MEMNQPMPLNFGYNLAMSVGNTLIVAFFVVCLIGIAAGVYAARALKRAEQSQMDGKKDQ
jgi:cbb3-type cytochrome oxidase subunit 3